MYLSGILCLFIGMYGVGESVGGPAHARLASIPEQVGLVMAPRSVHLEPTCWREDHVLIGRTGLQECSAMISMQCPSEIHVIWDGIRDRRACPVGGVSCRAAIPYQVVGTSSRGPAWPKVLSPGYCYPRLIASVRATPLVTFGSATGISVQGAGDGTRHTGARARGGLAQVSI